MARNPYGQYRTLQVETASPEDLISLAYDGARRFVDQALSAMEGNRLDEASQCTGRAQSVLGELAASLDPRAGEMATQLGSLYSYWTQRLGHALVKRDAAAYREVSTHLGEFCEAWKEASKSYRMSRSNVANGR